MKDKDIHIRIETKEYERIKDLAKKDRRKITAIIEIALERYLNSRKED